MLTVTTTLILKNTLLIDDPDAPPLPENYMPMNAEDNFTIEFTGGDAESAGMVIIGGQGAI